MKRIHYFSLLLAAALSACQQDREVSLIFTNPLDLQRNDAPVLLSREMIAGWTDVPGGLLPLITDTAGTPVPGQADDLDGDGEWDELFLLTDLGPYATVRVNLQFVSQGEYPSFTLRTNLRMGANEPGYPELERAGRLEGITYHNHARTGEVYQMEGPAWENDLVGFRNYMDQRNGMDIFGKITREMVLDSVGLAGGPSYHEPDWWGMDVLKVGTSLGAGAIAYRMRDTLYRVGDNGSGSYIRRYEGPLRSGFDLTYTGWNPGEAEMDVTHFIEIIGGHRFYGSQVKYEWADGGTVQSEGTELVTGIVNMKSDTLFRRELNSAYTGLMTHDYQAEDTTLLAMALLVPTERLTEIGRTPDQGEGITQTYFAALKAEPGELVPYRFYALWEREDPRWASHEEVFHLLREEAERWGNPVSVSLAD